MDWRFVRTAWWAAAARVIGILRGRAASGHETSNLEVQKDGDVEERAQATCVVGPAAPKGKGKGKGKDRPCAGTVTFEQDGGAACVIEWDLTGLSPGLHALAIHEHAVFDAGLAGAGARYNPHKAKLGGPYTVEKRVGDLGNVRAKRDGTSAGRTTNAQVCLWGDFNVAGRSVVVSRGRRRPDAPREATARVAGGEIVMCDRRA
ncbi:oxidoreductase [Aureococcus anophagefferens]|nr:oxidoreductase [Aureococcus anophagefferens]